MRAFSACHRAGLFCSCLAVLVSFHLVNGAAATRSPQEEISEENSLPAQDDNRPSWGAMTGVASAGESVLLRPYVSLLTRPSTLTASRGIPFVQRMVRSEYANHPFSFLKRGVMMGVDLPDFIMNQQNGNRIQAFRNRLIQSGRRR